MSSTGSKDFARRFWRSTLRALSITLRPACPAISTIVLGNRSSILPVIPFTPLPVLDRLPKQFVLSCYLYRLLFGASVPYCSSGWSKLLVPVNEGKLQGGAGGSYEEFEMDRRWGAGRRRGKACLTPYPDDPQRSCTFSALSCTISLGLGSAGSNQRLRSKHTGSCRRWRLRRSSRLCGWHDSGLNAPSLCFPPNLPREL